MCLSDTACVCWLFEVLGLAAGGEEMELNLMPETHYCRSLFYNMRNATDLNPRE